MARGARPQKGYRDRDGTRRWGAHHSVPDMLLGQRSDPASPAVNQAPALNQQTKETW